MQNIETIGYNGVALLIHMYACMNVCMYTHVCVYASVCTIYAN